MLTAGATSRSRRRQLHPGEASRAGATDYCGRVGLYRDPPAAWRDGGAGTLASVGSVRMRRLAAHLARMIRVDAVWLAVEPIDLRLGPESALARVVTVFGAAQPHHAYLFTNRRTNRLKILVHDGFGLWLAIRRLHQGRFVWSGAATDRSLSLTRAQLDALVLGLPWQCSRMAPKRAG